jgi:hypothetical protein
MMRRSALIALLATMMLAWPVQAQPTTRTLLDAPVVLHPLEPAAMCLEAGHGTLTAQTDVTQPPVGGVARPMIFNLTGDQADPSSNASFTADPNGSTTAIRLDGPMYCWRLAVDPNTLPANVATMGDAELNSLVQTVHLKLTFTPR